jgi:hypothetical protein
MTMRLLGSRGGCAHEDSDMHAIMHTLGKLTSHHTDTPYRSRDQHIAYGSRCLTQAIVHALLPSKHACVRVRVCKCVC